MSTEQVSSKQFLKEVIIVVIILSLIGVYTTSKDNTDSDDPSSSGSIFGAGGNNIAVNYSEGSSAEWSAQDALKEYNKASDLIEESVHNLREGNYEKAEKLATAADKLFKGNLLVGIDREITPGHKAGPMVTKLRYRLLAGAHEELKHLIERVGSGDATYEQARDFERAFDFQLGSLQRELFAAKDRIAANRAKAAQHVINLQTSSTRPEFNEVITTSIKNKFDFTNWKLMEGLPISQVEGDLIPKTLTAQLKINTATYQSSKGSYGGYLPQSVELTFSMRGDRNLLTTWDKLEPLAVRVELPQTVLIEQGVSYNETELKQLEDEKYQELAELLKNKLASLVEFQIFPDGYPANISPVEGNRVNWPALTAMNYLDRAQLVTTIRSLLSSENKRLLPDTYKAIVIFELGEFAEQLQGYITQDNQWGTTSVIAELRKRPWFGAFAPILRYAEKSPDNFNNVYQSLAAWQDQPEIAELFISHVLDENSENSHRWARTFLAHVPRHKLAEYYKWVASPRTKLATETIKELSSRDHTLIMQAMLENYANAQPEAQLEMLRNYRLTEGIHDTPESSFLVKAYNQANSEDLKQAAFQAMRRISYRPDIFNVVKDVALDQMPKSAERTTLLQDLLWASRQLHDPKLALDYHLEAFRKEISNLDLGEDSREQQQRSNMLTTCLSGIWDINGLSQEEKIEQLSKLAKEEGSLEQDFILVNTIYNKRFSLPLALFNEPEVETLIKRKATESQLARDHSISMVQWLIKKDFEQYKGVL